MADVWVLIPTAQKLHVPQVLQKWATRGYKIGIFVDPGPVDLGDVPLGLLMMGSYPGVWRAWNALAKAAFACSADVVVLAGDDMEPDPMKDAQELAREYLQRFPDGFGIMQPCGDPQGDRINGVPNSGRICGSPWIGRAWAERAYGGRGPVNGNYIAFYADEELKIVAERFNALWMRPDVSQFHLHWSWGHLPKQDYHERNQKSWTHDKEKFDHQVAEGFPDADPLVSNKAVEL